MEYKVSDNMLKTSVLFNDLIKQNRDKCFMHL